MPGSLFLETRLSFCLYPIEPIRFEENDLMIPSAWNRYVKKRSVKWLVQNGGNLGRGPTEAAGYKNGLTVH